MRERAHAREELVMFFFSFFFLLFLSLSQEVRRRGVISNTVVKESNLILVLSSPVLPELCSAGASLNPDLISAFLRRRSSLPVRPVVMEHVLQRSSTVARHRGGFHQLAPVTGGKPLTTSAGGSLPAFPSLSNPMKSIRLSVFASIRLSAPSAPFCPSL